MGHTIDKVKRAYWIITPEELKKKYLSVLKYLSIDSIKVHDIQSEKFNEILKDSKIKQQKIEDLERRFKALEDFSKKVNSIEEYQKLFTKFDLSAIVPILEKQKSES